MTFKVVEFNRTASREILEVRLNETESEGYALVYVAESSNNMLFFFQKEGVAPRTKKEIKKPGSGKIEVTVGN